MTDHNEKSVNALERALIDGYHSQSRVSHTVDVTLDGPHGAEPGDEWTIGAIPCDYRSGKLDLGDTLTEKRMHQAELTMNE